jgi:hypothetical protein
VDLLFRFNFDGEDENEMTYLSLHSTGQSCVYIDTDYEWWTPELLQAVLLKQVTLRLG